MGKLRSIQVLRGLAACAVVFLHATGSGLRGAAGVDLFFVISGFIMATLPKGPSFLLDRFWRIYPLWWTAVLPWLFWSPKNVFASVALLPTAMPALIVGWTLSFELLFYCAIALWMRLRAGLDTGSLSTTGTRAARPERGATPASSDYKSAVGARAAPHNPTCPSTPPQPHPFLAGLTSPANIAAGLLISGFAVMAGAAAVTHAAPFNFLGNPMILEFLFGAAIARLMLHHPLHVGVDAPLKPFLVRFAFGAFHPPSNVVLRHAFPLALLAVAVTSLVLTPTWIYSPELAMKAPASAWRVLYWGVPSAMIVYAFLSIEPLFAGKLWSFPVLLGDASYSIYLFHLLATDSLKLWWPLELAAGVGTGLIAWALIERPIIGAKKLLMVVLDRSRNRVPGSSGKIPFVPALVRAEIDKRVGL